MKTQHTPGPWKFDDNEGCRKIKGGKLGGHQQAQYQEIAWTVGLNNDDRDRANAVLMSEAPQMLKALEDLVTYVTSQEWRRYSEPAKIEPIRNAIEVIKKAKGE